MRVAMELSLRESSSTSLPDFSLGSMSVDLTLSPPPAKAPKPKPAQPPKPATAPKPGPSSKPGPAPNPGPALSTSSAASNLPLALHEMARAARAVARPVRDTFTPRFHLAAGRYTILLCVDNTETTGGAAGGKKNLKTETVRHLQATGVSYDTRGLNIGDFLWVAREEVQQVSGQFHQAAARELVLPFLVERKRMDDLWASVKDGRYEEQKWRMRNSGLEHLYYLVEEHPSQKQHWGGAQGGSVTQESIEQAIANTAVQEGFTVKRTVDQRSSVEFLTLITRLLSEKYRHLDLCCITQEDLEEGRVGSRDTALLEFKPFNDASRKTKKLTVREVFAKTLLRLKGLSVEMAQAIVTAFPCPALLRGALLEAPSHLHRVQLLTDLRLGIEAKRKLPKTIAEAVVKFWTSESLV